VVIQGVVGVLLKVALDESMSKCELLDFVEVKVLEGFFGFDDH
jgi:hypothetical protein